MAIVAHPTPNPNALKFSVGVDVGGPMTFAEGADATNPAAAGLLALEGVTSVFMTADFVTLSKSPEAEWDQITPEATAILADHFLGDSE